MTPPEPLAREIRYLERGQKIFDLYYWEQVLQESGDGGKVVVCQPKPPGQARAASPFPPGAHSRVLSPDTPGPGRYDFVMKMRSKEQLQQQGVSIEKFALLQGRLLNFPPHPGVMPLHEVFEDEKFFYIVMPRATGGSLIDGLLTSYADGNMPPQALKGLMREILSAIGHVHAQGMLHRDIKPDNIVLMSETAVLIDFDHADPEWSPEEGGSTIGDEYLGTMRFNAPETFLGRFSMSSDLYSAGCILYLLVTGQMPYNEDVLSVVGPCKNGWRTAVFGNLRDAGPIDFSQSVWAEQPLCESLCNQLLAFSPRLRPADARKALAHEWFTSAEDML